MPKLASNLSMLFPQIDFLDRFAAAANAGFRAVEYQYPYSWSPEESPSRAGGAGLHVVLHIMPRGDPQRSEHGTACLPGREARFRDDLEIAVRYARAAGCRRVHCMAGIAPPGADHARLHATYVSNLKYAARRLADEGMQLLIEPLSERAGAGCFHDVGAKAARTLDEVTAPNPCI